MDWNAAVEKNREVLKRILAALVALAGLADGSGTMPRHLHRAVLRLLRPAEAAARRLVIVAARGIVVAPPRSAWSRSPEKGGSGVRRLHRCGSSPAKRGRGTAEGGGGGIAEPHAMRPLTLPLFDRLPRWESRPRPVASGVPRISVPGFSVPFPVPPPPSPDDPVDAARLGRRLAALASALDDLPSHARRFARWRVRRDAAGAQNKQNRDAAGAQVWQNATSRVPHRRVRPRRAWPLRPGRPPGWRRRSEHEVHEVLNAVHGLAFWALNRPDTS